jgi:hypothetical protein
VPCSQDQHLAQFWLPAVRKQSQGKSCMEDMYVYIRHMLLHQ